MITWMSAFICLIIVVFAYFVGKCIGRKQGEKYVLDQIALVDRQKALREISNN